MEFLTTSKEGDIKVVNKCNLKGLHLGSNVTIYLGDLCDPKIILSKDCATQRRRVLKIKADDVQKFDALVDTEVTKKDIIDGKNDKDKDEDEDKH
jgi:hypothetical protein